MITGVNRPLEITANQLRVALIHQDGGKRLPEQRHLEKSEKIRKSAKNVEHSREMISKKWFWVAVGYVLSIFEKKKSATP